MVNRTPVSAAAYHESQVRHERKEIQRTREWKKDRETDTERV